QYIFEAKDTVNFVSTVTVQFGGTEVDSEPGQCHSLLSKEFKNITNSSNREHYDTHNE
ncbi:MAG: hypothetical protein J07HQX50_01723, partial [Haloquadratum sp. J07HQX50]